MARRSSKDADAVLTGATESVESVKSETAVEEKAEKKKFDITEPIRCTSVTAGELIMVGKKTKNVYVWSGYGDNTTFVEYQDLQAARLQKSQYIYEPLFIIDNEDIVNEWKDVATVYSKMCKMDEIAELFSLNNAVFKRTIASLPVGLKNALKTMAYDMVKDGTLDSIGKIKIIDEVLGTDIMSIITE